MAQLSHEQVSRSKAPYSLKMVCDGVSGPANIGSLFRLADAFGVQEIVFGNSSPKFDSDRMKRTSRGADQWINYRSVEDLVGFLSAEQGSGSELIALEITQDSAPIRQLKIVDHNRPIVLIIGAENRGVSPEVLQLPGLSVFHLPLYGRNSSINVAQAAAVALYHITEQF